MAYTLVHERMLVGAIDSFLSTIVHVRPHLASTYREQLEAFAEGWIDAGNPNEIESVSALWLESYLQTVEDRAAAEVALREFYRWAAREGLTDAAPLAIR